MNCKLESHSGECRIKVLVSLEADDEENVKTIYSTASKRKRGLRRLCSVDKVKFSSFG